MKKNIFIVAIATLALAMTACQKEDIVTPGNNVTPGTETPTTPMVKTTADLHNTNWTYTVTFSEFLSNMSDIDLSCMEGFEDDTMSFGLNFDGVYAHFTFPENVMAVAGAEGVMEQISSISYSYSYDGASHTGHLIGVVDDEDEDTPGDLLFTYDDATDVITFNVSLSEVESEATVNMTWNFVRAE